MQILILRSGHFAAALLASSSVLCAQGVLYDWPAPLYGQLGSVSSAGDLNGDGVSDFAYTQPAPQPSAFGRLIVRSGVNGSILIDRPGLAAGDGFGKLVARLGDVDGDGRDDLVVSAPLYVECISGATGVIRWRLALAGLASVASVPDLDGDGAPDWAAGLPSGQAAVVGAVQLRSGRTGALLSTLAPPPNASATFGTCVADAGDFDFDGLPEIFVGDPNGGSGSGAVSVHGTLVPGIPAYFQGSINPVAPQISSSFGASVATPGDVDGDGVPEVLVGSPSEVITYCPTCYEGTPNGRVRLLSGASGGQLQVFSQPGNSFGFGVEVGTYPDLDGDGLRELAVTSAVQRTGCCHYLPADLFLLSSGTGSLLLFAQFADATRFAVVPDVNGDGFDDLLLAQNFGGTRIMLPFLLPTGSAPPCPPKINSQNCIAWLGFTGCPSLTMGDDLRLSVTGMVPNSTGLFLFARQPATTPFSGGTLCVGGPLFRSQAMSTGGAGACSGSLALNVPKSLLSTLGGQPGSVLYVQAWYRDSGFSAPNDVGLSSSLPLLIWP